MSPDDYKPGLRVWYEPSPIGGVRFLGTLTEPPRKLGSSWVASVEMKTDAYGQWRRFGGEGGALRMAVPAASLDCLFVDRVPSHRDSDDPEGIRELIRDGLFPGGRS